MAKSTADTLNELDALLKDDFGVWRKLKPHSIKDFNIFNMLKIDLMEIRHSNVLAWLMNPQGSHGLGDAFLKNFFAEIEKIIPCFCEKYNNSKSGGGGKGFGCIDNSFEADREIFIMVDKKRSFIDILLVSEATKRLIVIENKIRSKEHDNQLKKYYEAVEQEYSDYNKVFLYLTPTDEEITDSLWTRISYKQVLPALSSLNLLSVELRVGSTIEQYKQIVEKLADDTIGDICRNINRNHRNAIKVLSGYSDYEKRKGLDKHILDKCKELYDAHDKEADLLISRSTNAPPIDCTDLGIAIGERLQFKDDTSIEIIVLGNLKYRYVNDGGEYDLTKMTRKAMKPKLGERWDNKDYWLYKGELLRKLKKVR